MSRVHVYIGVEREAEWLRYIVRSLPTLPVGRDMCSSCHYLITISHHKNKEPEGPRPSPHYATPTLLRGRADATVFSSASHIER